MERVYGTYSIRRRVIELVVCLALMLGLLIPLMPPLAPYLAYDITQSTAERDEMVYYVTRVILWNGGRTEITGADILAKTPLTLAVDDPENVFFRNVVGVTDKGDGFKLTFDDAAGQGIISFDHVAPGNRAEISLYHYTPAVVTLRGALRDNMRLVHRQDVPPVLGIPLTILTVVLLVLMGGQLVMTLIRYLKQRQGKKGWTFPNPLLLLERDRIENYDPPKPSRFAKWFFRHWPAMFTLLWLVLYAVAYWVL